MAWYCAEGKELAAVGALGLCMGSSPESGASEERARAGELVLDLFGHGAAQARGERGT